MRTSLADWSKSMAIVAAKLSVAAQDNKGLSVEIDKEFWTLIRSHPDLTVEMEVVNIMTCLTG